MLYVKSIGLRDRFQQRDGRDPQRNQDEAFQRVHAFSIRPRTPTSLFFAIAAVLHAAPQPSMRLACIDEIDLAVGCAALADTTVIGRDKQGFYCERTGVQRNFRRGWRDPTMPDRV